jgi:hypothetical protein
VIDMRKVDNLKRNPSASAIEIDKIEIEMKVTLPKVYREFLKYSNGFSIGNGLLIYGTHDIIGRNLTWEIEAYAKGYIAVGDDGGSNIFLMEQKFNSTNVYVVDASYINPEETNRLTSDFIQWINDGCVIYMAQNTSRAKFDTCDIVLEILPDGGLKDLLTIKNIVGLDITANELLKGSKKLPFVLVKNFPYGKATKIIEKLGTLGKVLRIEE